MKEGEEGHTVSLSVYIFLLSFRAANCYENFNLHYTCLSSHGWFPLCFLYYFLFLPVILSFLFFNPSL